MKKEQRDYRVIKRLRDWRPSYMSSAMARTPKINAFVAINVGATSQPVRYVDLKSGNIYRFMNPYWPGKLLPVPFVALSTIIQPATLGDRAGFQLTTFN
jgi:hypothetical protein